MVKRFTHPRIILTKLCFFLMLIHYCAEDYRQAKMVKIKMRNTHFVIVDSSLGSFQDCQCRPLRVLFITCCFLFFSFLYNCQYPLILCNHSHMEIGNYPFVMVCSIYPLVCTHYQSTENRHYKTQSLSHKQHRLCIDY